MTSDQAAMRSKSREESVKDFNQILKNGSEEEFLESLIDPNLGISDLVDKFAIPLYFEEMKTDRIVYEVDLAFSEIVADIKILTAVANITKAVDTKDSNLVYEALSCSDAYIVNLEIENKEKYSKALIAIRSEKLETAQKCTLLTYFEVQDCIDIVNEQSAESNKVVDELRYLNEAVTNNSRSEMKKALEQILPKLNKKTSPNDASLYLRLLKQRLNEKRHDSCELQLEDVDKVTEIVLSESEDVELVSTVLVNINMGLESDDLSFTTNFLYLIDSMLTDKQKLEIFEALQRLKRTKEQKYTCPYVRYKTSKGNESFIDIKHCVYTWDPLKSIPESRYITSNDIGLVLKSVAIADYYKKSTNKDFEKLIVNLQARTRGYLLRKKVAHNTGTIVDNRAPRCGIMQRRNCRLLHIEIKDGPVDARKIQNAEGTIETVVMDHYRKHEGKIIKIQALWRGRAAKRAFHSLLRSDKPPFSVVQRFCGILNFNAANYARDFKIKQQRKHDFQFMKQNQKLSHELNKIDRCTENKNTAALSAHMAIQRLSVEYRPMLEDYQHLFYELQTNPNYVAKLLLIIPEKASQTLLMTMFQQIFNLGSSLRDEYFLLKLIETALKEEIRNKFKNPSEVVTDKSLALKMAVKYTRKSSGPPALRKIMGPIIEQLIHYETIRLELNPVEIYKHWQNKREAASEQASKLPCTVTAYEALEHDEVQSRLNRNMNLLMSVVRECLKQITALRNSIPYGMRYIAKVLRDTLTEKFPEASEASVLKVVGNLIYHSFINDVLSAADAYNAAAPASAQVQSNELRKYLEIVTRFLAQFAASEKGLREEPLYLQTYLNAFALKCHEELARFFRDCCAIEGLDRHFKMNEYTEATLAPKPEIAMSLRDARYFHSLLAEYQDRIAPDQLDPLHMILDDLGYIPSIAMMMETWKMSIAVGYTDELAKSENKLVLSKFKAPKNVNASLDRLFMKTKELLVSIIQLLKGETLLEALETEQKDISISMSRRSASLEDCKQKLRAYLNQLELGGRVSRGDAYQNIVTEIAKDLRSKGRYKFLPNNEKEMLEAVIDNCLENLNRLDQVLFPFKNMPIDTKS